MRYHAYHLTQVLRLLLCCDEAIKAIVLQHALEIIALLW